MNKEHVKFLFKGLAVGFAIFFVVISFTDIYWEYKLQQSAADLRETVIDKCELIDVESKVTVIEDNRMKEVSLFNCGEPGIFAI